MNVKTLLPVIKSNNQMNFIEWKYLDPLKVNKFGMLEPCLQNKNVVPNFMLVPLLNFDNYKNRLGYGKGFYDRFLNKFLKSKKNITTIGVAFSFQKYNKLPATNLDIKLDYILTEKQELVKQAGFEMTQGKAGFENIGGLTKLKEWITAMRIRFTERAREYANLEPPNGLLLAGVPGCGKSEIGKAISYEWGFNVLRVDASDLKGSLVGESEAKARKLLDTAKAAAPIIVFIDEAEKLLGASDGVNDGGAHDAVLGQFLSFMQDDDSGVFFVFTANKMEKFPPELIDRFEGRFFVDLPSSVEREAILKIHLTARNWGMAKQEDFDIGALVSASKSFSGRNIRDVITEASTFSLLQDRPMEQADVLAAFSTTIPTSKTKKTEIETMRTFVENGMMRKANDEPLAVKGKEAGKRFVSFN